MKQAKGGFKPLVLFTLLIVFTILVFLPKKNYAKTVIYPGLLGPGEYGYTCYCPRFPYYDCGCQIEMPLPY